jgi:hypothetical protein
VDKSSHEREQLRGFSLAVLDELQISTSEWALEPLRTTTSVRGLCEAARDMVEMCEDLPADQVAALDARLVREGLPTLSLMRDARYRDFLRVLSRGRIESAEEFRLVNSYISDVDSPHLSPEARSTANALLGEFESTG